VKCFLLEAFNLPVNIYYNWCR